VGGRDDHSNMPLDHYISQVHLKNFYSPVLGERLYAMRKSYLKSLTPDSKSVCRISDGSTNAYLRVGKIGLLIDERKFLEELDRAAKFGIAWIFRNGRIRHSRERVVIVTGLRIVPGVILMVPCLPTIGTRIIPRIDGIPRHE
jgi:hypothetical protein